MTASLLSGPAQGIFDDAVSDNNTAREETLFSLGGFTRASAWFGGDDYDYASLFGEFALQGRISGNSLAMYGDIRVSEGTWFGERETRVRVREAYAGLRWDRADLFVGQQVVAWGRTDGFNPVDNISPRDYFLLSSDPDDQLEGNFMLRSRLRPVPGTELEIIAIPFYKPSVYRYDLFDMDDGVVFADAATPEASFSNGSLAARLTAELPSAGFSFSYFSGYAPFYGFNLDGFSFLPEPEITYRPEMYRKRAPGFDMSVVAGSNIFRLETAYNITTAYQENIHIPNPELYYVAAAERSIGGINTIFQYIGKYVSDFTPLEEPAPPDMQNPLDLLRWASESVIHGTELYNRRIFLQQEEFNHALFLALSRSFYYEELRVELSGYYNITSEEYFIRPEIRWSARDGMLVNAGAHIMKGPEESIFNMAGKVLGGFFAGIRMSF